MKWLKEIRQSKLLTQKDVSESLKITLRTLQNYEQGICEPSLKCLREMANLFNCSLDYLITGKENTEKIYTKDLVEELSKREGVEKKIAEPYQNLNVSVNGPAIILVVID